MILTKANTARAYNLSQGPFRCYIPALHRDSPLKGRQKGCGKVLAKFTSWRLAPFELSGSLHSIRNDYGFRGIYGRA